MTIRQIIDKADNLYPNQYSEEHKLSWLNTLERQIYNDIVSTHEGGESRSYSAFMDADKNLVADDAYEDMYVSYLIMRVDEANKDVGRYNNSAMIFNANYDAFAKDYNKTHMPKGVRHLSIY